LRRITQLLQDINYMRRGTYFILLLICVSELLNGQNEISDSTKNFRLEEVIVTASRMPILLKNNPGSISLVTPEVLSIMPKSAGAEEALRLIPGVRIDNQHDGERIHMSIRGQGILTERGLRGIGVLIDGMPVNDPSGFAPDLYDVDWATVNKIEVLRGPSASLYGGGGAAGVLSISTNNGGLKALGGEVNQSFGSNGFSKSLVQLDGSHDNLDYRVSYSRTGGDGYRDHQAFWGNKIYEKINFRPSRNLSITQIISHTDYFQQNPEGLNISQFNDLRQANPDANPFNEYQKTNRTTIGFHAKYTFSELHDVEVTSFLRSWNYKETSNKYAEYRNITNPGSSFQYNLHLSTGKIKNDISVGSDLKWQNIGVYKLQSAGNPLRKESISETNLETDSLLANQIISQSSLGIFALYKLGIEKVSFVGSIRYETMNNELTNKMVGLDSARTLKNFGKASARIGLNYSLMNAMNVFVDWSHGFLPPSTEELASNPTGYSGFNTHLVPATANCNEIGIRGFYSNKLSYEITAFIMNTKNDFFRFKQSGRGNQEVFYGNAGNSKRFGIETFISYEIFKNLSLQVAYTYADYKYTSSAVDPVYTDPAYVLTSPPAKGQWLPNSPKHQLYSELVFKFAGRFKFSFASELQSKWAIYTDTKAYNGELDPVIYQNWQDGFNLFHARISYELNIRKVKGECSIFVRNITSAKYMAFTEPDPDGNAYHPGPTREFFGNIKIRF
jgi:iron complex outermembrane receptor protein